MGSLRDELLKKGLVDARRERRVRHSEENRQKAVGRRTVEAERQRRDQEYQKQRAQARQADQERAEHQATEEQSVEAWVRRGLVANAQFGNRRFHFVTRENRVSFIDVSNAAQRALADGRQGIVEARGQAAGDFCVVTADSCRAILAVEPECVVFFNQSPAGRGG